MCPTWEWGRETLGGRGLEDLDDEPPSPRSRSMDGEMWTINAENIWPILQSTTSTFILLTVLPSGRSNIPDARRQLALSPLMGGVA